MGSCDCPQAALVDCRWVKGDWEKVWLCTAPACDVLLKFFSAGRWSVHLLQLGMDDLRE